jgi:hypothetical protein
MGFQLNYVSNCICSATTEAEGSKRKGKERPQVTVEVRGGEVKAEGGSKTPAAAVPGYEEQPGRICDGCRNKAIVSNEILYDQFQSLSGSRSPASG